MYTLEAEIKRLEVEYNMFFAGRLPRLPWEQRTKVLGLVRRYDRSDIQNTADRFRFNNLQARFSAFVDLWERQLKAQEQGRPRGARAVVATSARLPFAHRSEAAPEAAPEPPPPAPPEAPSRPTLEAPPPELVVEHVVRLHDPDRELERVQELYEYLAEAKKAAGQPPVTYDVVAALARDQVHKYRPTAQSVVFTVALKEGRVLLTVAPDDAE